MSLTDLTSSSVHQAIAEFDEIGRDAFLNRYGYKRSRGYFIVYNGARYDSKAVAGAAHGYLPGQLQALKPNEFSGGERTVAKRLRELGFTVAGPAEVHGEIPFEMGKLYNRLQDIHEVYDGQRQGGISTPDATPYVFLFTGETGEQYGYSDGWRSDGLFAYTGEGQRGDMEFVRGNRAIRDHLANGRDLLLFEATKNKGQYRFRGCFACAGWELRPAPDRDGVERHAIVFHLTPVAEVEMVDSDEQVETDLTTKSLEELRHLALAAAQSPHTPPKEARRNYYERSAAVKLYVLKRAAGHCECCRKEAPFVRKNGTPYLEPHHTKRVADGGPDHPRFVGAVCPSCHREIHHGKNGVELNNGLETYLKTIEPEGPTSSPALR